MKQPKKVFSTTIVFFLMLSMVLAATSLFTPMVSAAAATITLSTSQGAAGSSVNITGTGFAANSAVGIGFGGEVANSETLSFSFSGSGPYTDILTLSKTPIKPGTLSFTSGTGGGFSYTDDKAGNLVTLSPNFISGTISYATGQITQVTTTPSNGFITPTYTTYGNNVSPSAGITTSASGSFTAKITIPNVSNGNYTVTAISDQGNLATSTFTITAAAPTLAITLSSSSGAAGSSVNITGIGFATNSAVGIAFGAEIAITGDLENIVPSGGAGLAVSLAYSPIKPGTYSATIPTTSLSFADNGVGALTSTSPMFISGTINYATGTLAWNSTSARKYRDRKLYYLRL